MHPPLLPNPSGDGVRFYTKINEKSSQENPALGILPFCFWFSAYEKEVRI